MAMSSENHLKTSSNYLLYSSVESIKTVCKFALYYKLFSQTQLTLFPLKGGNLLIIASKLSLRHNLGKTSWGTVEAQLKHSRGKNQLGQNWGRIGAELGQKLTWGTVEAQSRQKVRQNQ